MKYRSIVIFCTLLLGAAFFCGTGIRFVKSGDAAKREVYVAHDKREQEESEKIAVVNLDEGVSGNGGYVNYAEKLSRFPSMDFEYSSLEAARTGLETGKYGAYVIIPAVFSKNVESINTAPQTSRLEYAVNRSYSGKKQYELLYHVRSYIDSLNNHLSYMYVDNILREFHEAQDGADRVLENDLKDKAALEKIQAHDLVTLTEAPKMAAEENMPEILDISGYTAQSFGLAESIDAVYESSIQDIQTEVSSLSNSGAALSARLKELAGQAPDLNLTVDGNGEDIAEKADNQLRAELERQLEGTLEKESMIQCLGEYKSSNEEFIRRFEQSVKIYQSYQDTEQSDADPHNNQNTEQLNVYEILYDDQNQPVLDSDGRPKSLISLLEEENQKMDSLLGEIEQAETLDIDKISELVKTEYVEPMRANAGEAENVFQQRYEEELAAVSAYNGQLDSFQPQMNGQFLAQSVHELEENHRSIQSALLKNQQAYTEYAQKLSASSKEYADELQKYAAEAKKASDEAVAEGLSAAKEVKEKNSAVNRGILRKFALKLPYTRLGSAECTQVYQLIANPLTAVDKSRQQTAEN